MSLKSTIEDRILTGADKAANATNTPAIFDVAQILQTLYGFKPIVIPGLPAAPANTNEFIIDTSKLPKRRVRTNQGSPIYGLQDMIGRQVFLPLTIVANGVDYDFPFTVIGIKCKKILIETPMIERSASVIEEIGVDAYRISVKGFLVDPLNDFPDNQLYKLKEMFECKTTVKIKSALVDIFLGGNDQVVISNLDVPEKPKVIGVRDFSFELIQDGVLDLYAVK
ncbi:MAG: hypothetical protein H7289_07865 [Mucilaginibacter sp.]|nr:hypothetical protein [Mucilaginibacter sp.]